MGTMCGHTFYQPMKNSPTKFVNLDKSGDSFYYDNVDRYVRTIMQDVGKVEADAVLKGQILVNVRMVLLANQLNKIRGEGEISAEAYAQLLLDAEQIRVEFSKLWDLDNFPEGKAVYLNTMDERLAETKEYVK